MISNTLYFLIRAVELTRLRVKELIAIKKINAVNIFNAWQNIVHIGNITV